MLSFLLSPEFRPFAIAGLVMIGLLAIETISALFGTAASTTLDTILGLHGAHADLPHGDVPPASGAAAPHGALHSADGPFATVFDWLNAGRVPLLVLMMAAIASFAVTGMVLQIVAMHLAAPLPAVLAAIVAAAAAVPGTRWSSRAMSWLMPRDETYALTDEDLIGRVGIVTLGPVVEGGAARAKVQDKYGNWHFPRVKPGAAGLSIPEGARILVVDRAGREFAVVPAEGRLAATAETVAHE